MIALPPFSGEVDTAAILITRLSLVEVASLVGAEAGFSGTV